MVTERRTRTEDLKKRSVAHIFHGFGVPGAAPELVIEKGKGIILTDTDGNEYMDMCSFVHCANLGYCRQELADAAYKQLNQLSYMSTMARCTNIPAVEYAEALTEFTPKNINHFFFCSLGSGATETAIKMSKAYWYFQGVPSKIKTICLMEAYHGATALTQSLMTDPDLRVGLRNLFKHSVPEDAGHEDVALVNIVENLSPKRGFSESHFHYLMNLDFVVFKGFLDEPLSRLILPVFFLPEI